MATKRHDYTIEYDYHPNGGASARILDSDEYYVCTVNRGYGETDKAWRRRTLEIAAMLESAGVGSTRPRKKKGGAS